MSLVTVDMVNIMNALHLAQSFVSVDQKENSLLLYLYW